MTTTRLRITPILAALIAGSAALLVTARDAQAVGVADGRITGTITEAQTAAPVPGAVVTLKGGSGVNKKTQTAEDGTYDIGAIPPGTYDLLVTYEGLKPVKRKVVVNPDQATPVNIAWSAESAQEETTVVEEERHLTNPDSSQTGQIYSIARANQLPITRSYQSIATQIPGVTSNAGGNPNVKGAKSNNNRYLVNGLDLTDPVTNTFASNMQQDSLESVQLTTGGFEAKYNALGAIVAVQTRRGTNKFHGAASAYWAPTQLVDYDTFGPQVYDGSKPFDYSAVRPEQGRYELNVTAQGPIVKDRLFFNVGLLYSKNLAAQPPGPARFVQAPSRVSEAFNLLAGVTLVPSDDHRIHTEVSADPTTIEYENNSGASANNSTPYSQQGRSQGGYRGTVEWAWQASKHVATKVLAGFAQNSLNVGPQGLRGIDPGDLINGVAYNFNRPAHGNADDGTSWFNTGAHDVTIRRRYQLDASVTATGEAGGHHEAEFGVQTSLIEQRRTLTPTGGTAGQDDSGGYGISYADKGGGLLDGGLCDLDPYINPAAPSGTYTGNGCNKRTITRAFAEHESGHTFGVYVQDRFKPKRWLTILPGMRWDVGTVAATDSDVAVTASGFGPRLSVIADVTNDSKTIFQASYGRTTELPSLRGASGYDGSRRSFSVTEQYDSTQRAFVFNNTAGGAQGSRLRFDHVTAAADEILLSGRRELTKGVMARVDYTYRYFRRQYEDVETNAILDPTGTRTAAFANGIPTRVTESGFNPGSTASYSGLDLIMEIKLTDFEVQGGYTLSQSWGTAGSGAFDNPRFAQFYNSYQGGVDTRHQIKTSTTYSFFGFNLGVILNYSSGVALAKAYGGNESGMGTIRRAPIGYEPGAYYNTGTSNPNQLGTFSDIRSWATFRSPDIFVVNVLLGYDFYKLINEHVTANVQINNVLGLQTTTSVNGTEGAPQSTQFGLQGGKLGFRTLTLGLRYEF